MNIIHVIDYISPQLGYQETYLARQQKKLGHSVRVITSDRYFPFPNYEDTVGKILGKRIVGTGKRHEEGISIERLPVRFELFTRCYLIGLIERLVQLKPDAIHIHSASSLNAVRIALSKNRFPHTKIICDDHSHYSVVSAHWSKQVFYSFFRMFFGKLLTSNIDAFAAITGETKRIMKTLIGIRKHISVIELGADTQLFTFNKEKRLKLRKKLNMYGSDFVLIYTGKIIPEKGVDILVKAFCSVYLPHLKLLIVGSGEEYYIHALQEHIRNSGKDHDVIWVPMVRPTELPAYYSVADVGIWPRQESISMIEAMSCELPVLVKNSPSMRERIQNCGFAYDEGNIDDLRKKIVLSIHGKNSIRAHMGREGRKLVIQKYSWMVIAEKFISLYRT